MCACGHVGRVMASCAQRRPYCSDPDSWCRRRGRCNSGQRNRTSCQNPRRAASAWEGLWAQRTKHTPQAHAAAAHVCAGRVEGRELHRLILDRNAERAEPVVTCTMWCESAVAGHAVQRRRAHARGTGTDLGGGGTYWAEARRRARRRLCCSAVTLLVPLSVASVVAHG